MKMWILLKSVMLSEEKPDTEKLHMVQFYFHKILGQHNRKWMSGPPGAGGHAGIACRGEEGLPHGVALY